jgi:hypothetical protein
MAVANISHLYKVFRLVKKWKEVQQSGIVTFNGKKTQSIADTLPIYFTYTREEIMCSVIERKIVIRDKKLK